MKAEFSNIKTEAKSFGQLVEKTMFFLQAFLLCAVPLGIQLMQKQKKSSHIPSSAWLGMWQ
ncbi:hypothetical protein P4487_02415, partial [Bacillus subtilis]|nr:hypothetical protein [Bacillus subtilis]